MTVCRVSVGLPVYNGENYLSEAIESVLSQSYKDFELIISDNGSNDSTPEICRRYASLDSRIVCVRSKANLGAAWNFNRVFQLASGEYFKWMAHDDIIAPDFLKECVEVLDTDPSAILAYSKAAIVDEKKRLIDIYGIKLRSDSPDPATRFHDLVLAWSLCLEVFGLIRTDYLRTTEGMGSYGHGDGVLLARLGLLGRFVEVPEVLSYSRKHNHQSVREFGLSEEGGNDYHLYTLWFDPSKANHLIFPNWRIAAEYSRCIRASGLSSLEKVFCYLTVVRWMRQNVRHLFRDLVISVQFISRHKQPRGSRII